MGSSFVPLESFMSSTLAYETQPQAQATPRTARPPAQPIQTAPDGHYFCRELKLLTFDGQAVLFDVERFRMFTVAEETVMFLRSIAALDAGPSWEPVYVPDHEHTRDIVDFLLRCGILSAEAFPPPAEMVPVALPPLGLTLHVNHICNLRCVYCYADGGTYGGKPITMSEEVITRSIETFLEVCHPQMASIHWFGGEPLISFDQVRFGTLYAEERAHAIEKRISFGVTSNGTMITDEISRFLAEHHFNVVISCDGTPEVHDRLRPRADGKGSYGDLMQGVACLRRHGVAFGFRATATRDRMNLGEQISHLGSLSSPRGVDLQFDVHKTQHGAKLTPGEAEELRLEYRKVADKLINGEDAASLQQYVGLRDMIQQVVSKKRKQRGCLAGTASFAVHPEGHVFPCHRFVTDVRFRVGNILEGFRFEVEPRFLNAIVFNREPCASCWARYLCGGACYNICSENSGNILQPPEFYCQNMLIKASEALRMVWKAAELTHTVRTS